MRQQRDLGELHGPRERAARSLNDDSAIGPGSRFSCRIVPNPKPDPDPNPNPGVRDQVREHLVGPVLAALTMRHFAPVWDTSRGSV